ncbi:MAG: hypothetical protein FWG36_09345 [Oscillospiraceae bacterium]|nr:hypothetical protein [Oscillospiraceae bacterium]
MAHKENCMVFEARRLQEAEPQDYDIDEIRNMYGTSGTVNSRGTVKIEESA